MGGKGKAGIAREGRKAPELTEEQAAEVRRRLAKPDPKFIALAEARARLLPDEA